MSSGAWLLLLLLQRTLPQRIIRHQSVMRNADTVLASAEAPRSVMTRGLHLIVC